MKKQILVVGSLNMDIAVEMPRMPKCGETVLGNRLAYMPGGKGANQACAIGRLGGNVVMLGCVGKDNFGKRQIEDLTQCGVCMKHIKEEGSLTGTAVIFVDEEGSNSIVVLPGANDYCDINYIKKQDKLFQEAGYVMFQMEIPIETVCYGIRRAKELGKKTLLNPAPVPDCIPDELWKYVDYLTPNETELMKLTGIKDTSDNNIREGAKKLLEKGIKNVLVTLGERGVLLVNAELEKYFPARKVHAIDTTAAGDCFNGAFAVALSEGMAINKAIEFANVASSIAVTRKGAQSSIPYREEVNKYFKERTKI